jgi:radical SAM enzyme (rSAM/lipoprotein system)
MSRKPSLRQRMALELHRRIHKNNIRLHEMDTLFWECTLRCNVACRHCGSDCRAVTGTPDMPAEDFLGVVRQLAPHIEPNRTMVIFTGGEALLRDDLEACGLELYRMGFPWGLVTNGLLLDRKRLDLLLAAGLHSITVSLDGFEQEHNWLRRHPKSYNGAMNAIRMLAGEKEVVWDVVTCANRNNIETLPELRETLIGAGVKRWRIFTVFPSGRAAELPELQLTDEEFTALMDFIAATRREGRIRVDYGCEGFLGRYEGKVRNGFYECRAGVNVASVLADGSISACPSIRADLHQGNIYRDDFAEVWNNRFEPFRNRAWARKGECAACEMFRYCEGNGMHLHDGEGNLAICHYKRIKTTI